jgi:ATP-dependent RNA helicase DeaD
MTPLSEPGATDPSLTAAPQQRFPDLGLPEPVLARLGELGFVRPTPIQSLSIPIVLDGDDLIGKAETGTGKTLAFAAPVIGMIDPDRVAVQALVLCPTRELAQQVEEVAASLGEPLGIRTALLVGGIHQAGQILALRRGAHFAVGTPGRVLDFLRQGVLRLGYAHHVILDEADRMLDMGFIDDVSAILERTPAERQTLLFSATIPPRIRALTERFMHDPHTVATTKGLSTVPDIRQRFAKIGRHDKERFLLELLDRTRGETCMVFCNTRRAVVDLDRVLWGRGYPAGSLHGDHDQEKRFKVLDGFKAKQITTLVATDVAGRGLDIEAVHRVVNYDVPDEVETYVHRIGRTGRAGELGESNTLVSPLERRNWERIVAATRFAVEEIPFSGSRAPRGEPRDEGGRGRGGHGFPRYARGGSGGHRGRGGGPRRGAPSAARPSSGAAEASGAPGRPRRRRRRSPPPR